MLRNLTSRWASIIDLAFHATEYREQIKSRLSALGVTPSDIAGWEYGDITKAMVPILK